MPKYTICLDFDGVIHSCTSGYQGKPWIIPDPPVEGSMEWLKDFYIRSCFEEIFAVAAIYSTRSKSIRGRRAMKQWLRKNLFDRFGNEIGPSWDPLYLEIVDWIQWPIFKPPALVSVDDRAVRFEGDWNDPGMTPDRLIKMRPWFKK